VGRGRRGARGDGAHGAHGPRRRPARLGPPGVAPGPAHAAPRGRRGVQRVRHRHRRGAGGRARPPRRRPHLRRRGALGAARARGRAAPRRRGRRLRRVLRVQVPRAARGGPVGPPRAARRPRRAARRAGLGRVAGPRGDRDQELRGARRHPRGGRLPRLVGRRLVGRRRDIRRRAAAGAPGPRLRPAARRRAGDGAAHVGRAPGRAGGDGLRAAAGDAANAHRELHPGGPAAGGGGAPSRRARGVRLAWQLLRVHGHPAARAARRARACGRGLLHHAEEVDRLVAGVAELA
jgi:hypothetical protein